MPRTFSPVPWLCCRYVQDRYNQHTGTLYNAGHANSDTECAVIIWLSQYPSCIVQQTGIDCIFSIAEVANHFVGIEKNDIDAGLCISIQCAAYLKDIKVLLKLGKMDIHGFDIVQCMAAMMFRHCKHR